MSRLPNREHFIESLRLRHEHLLENYTGEHHGAEWKRIQAVEDLMHDLIYMYTTQREFESWLVATGGLDFSSGID